ncbi:MAG: PRD domain-containing protein [Erysipelotrichaceae bacterium]|nr:PRD domain-containing protein [Erysipelotrichaceae bacterium]MCI9524687.1 PRD domain-containing protein [Erysipelotrichaceae bacterium]
MVIIKVFNNNSVAALSDDRQDVIVTGSGIGFRKKAGDRVDESKIERQYVFQDEHKKRLEQSLTSIPNVCFEITEWIVKKATQLLEKDFSSEIFIAISDHISFVIKRKNEGIYLPNIILNETKILYKEEYEVGLLALDHIKKKAGVQLDEDEAGYIALHLANFSLNNHDSNAVKIVTFTKEVIDVIQNTMKMKLGQDTLAYARISIHLKYLSERIFRNEVVQLEDTTHDIREMLKSNPRLSLCINRIVKLIRQEYAYELSPDEQTYLCIHIRKNIV